MSTDPGLAGPSRHPGNALEVFWVFLRLGLTSFGGPMAHLGFFRETFVQRRRWLSDRAYADLVALCQFLPGPASSQVGMAIGLHRAGVLGMLAAWTAFTLPSAILLIAFAYGAAALGDAGGTGWMAGLKAAAVAVVAHALLGMARTLAPDAPRATIAAGAMVAVLLLPNAMTQVAVIVVAGLAGLAWLRAETATPDHDDTFTVGVPRGIALACLTVFVALLVSLPVVAAATGNGVVRLIDVFYRAGALVFGGGHVVLPLLQAETVQTGLVTHEAFLAGYGAAQAVPGPLFTFAAYLGVVTTTPPTGLTGAVIALVTIFLPAGLLVVGTLPFWQRLRHVGPARRALMGVNAAVVGILAAALYTPVGTEGITGPGTLAVAVSAFVALLVWKAPAWAVVIAAAVVGWILL